MRFWKNVTVSLLVCILFFHLRAQEVNNQSADEWLLTDYLSQGQGSSAPKHIVQELIDNGQVFFVEYQRDEPIHDESDRKEQEDLEASLKKKGIITIRTSMHKDGNTYPWLMANFSKLSNDNNSDSKEWLDLMRKPIEAGYELKSVHIVYQPSMEIKTQSYKISREIIANIANELQKISSEYEQFSDFNNAIITVGEFNDDTKFPVFASLSYRYGYEEGIKGISKTTQENWCNIEIGFYPETGILRQRLVPGKKYRRQGINAFWNIVSADRGFNEKVSDIVIKSFVILDEYEQELEKKQSVSSVATRLKENAEMLKVSDRKLNEKWDLPDDVIVETPTDKLFLHFINSPSVAMLMLYDTPEPGLARLLDANHALREFYNRDDMVQGALKMYSEYDLSPESMTDEEIRKVFSRTERTRNSSFIQNNLAPDNIVNMKIARITMNIMYADEILLSRQFLPKLKGYEREFLKAMLERYEKIVELRQKYGEDFAPALSCVPHFCICMAENLDDELYKKLMDIEIKSEFSMEEFLNEIRMYLN